MFSYNPFTFAIAAAYDEITSDRAKAFYADTAKAHSRRALDDSIITMTYAVAGIAAVAQFIYHAGQVAGAAHFDAVAEYHAPKALPAPKAVLALAPAPARRVNAVRPVHVQSPIVPFVSSNDIPDYDLAIEAKEVKRAIARSMKAKKRQLIAQCEALGLPTFGTKHQLAVRLATR